MIGLKYSSYTHPRSRPLVSTCRTMAGSKQRTSRRPVERVLCQPADTRLLSLLSRRIYGPQAMRAAGYVFKRSSGTHFPICCLSCDARRATKTLFADGAYLAAYLAARREDRVYVRIGSAGANGGDDRGKVTSIELLRCLRPGYDICGRDPASHGALLRALRRKAGRIRICRRLAQKDDDATGYA